MQLNKGISNMDIAFGTMVFDYTKGEIAVLIKTYPNPFADAPDHYTAQILRPNGKKDLVDMDDITPVD